METAGRADELPPIVVRPPAGAIGWQEVVIAIAPDGTFTPRVATIAPIGPTRWAASGFPVFTGEVRLGGCNCGLGSIAPFEAIGSGFFWG